MRALRRYAWALCLAPIFVLGPAVAQPPAPAPEPDEIPSEEPPEEQPEEQPEQPVAPPEAPEEAPEEAPDDEEPQGDPIGTDPLPADGPTADEEPDELGDAHRPRLELRVSDGELFTGDVVTLTLTALAPASDDISVPSEQDVAPFEIIDTNARTEERGADVLHTFTLELLALEPGEHELGPFQVRVLTPEGVIGLVDTEPLTIRVGSVLGNEPNAEPRPPTEPVQVLEEDPTLYWVGGGLLLVLFTALFTWLFARWWRARERAAAPPPPPRPPEEIALEKLKVLRQRRDAMLREGQGVEFVDRVSDAVREYLGHRFAFDGLESTTDEVLARMRKETLRGVGIEEIAGLLQDCDLVKFAKADFTLEQSDLLLTGSFRIVRETTNAMPATPSSPSAEPSAPTPSPAKEGPAESRWMPKAPPPAEERAEEATASVEAEEAPQAHEPGVSAPVGPASPITAADPAPGDDQAKWAPPASAATSASPAQVEGRPIPDTVPPGTKDAAALADAAADAAAGLDDDTTPDPAAAEADEGRPIPDTIPPAAPTAGDSLRSADTLRGVAIDPSQIPGAEDATEGES